MKRRDVQKHGRFANQNWHVIPRDSQILHGSSRDLLMVSFGRSHQFLQTPRRLEHRCFVPDEVSFLAVFKSFQVPPERDGQSSPDMCRDHLRQVWFGLVVWRSQQPLEASYDGYSHFVGSWDFKPPSQSTGQPLGLDFTVLHSKLVECTPIIVTCNGCL